MSKYTYSVKQVDKRVNPATNKVAYRFEFFRNGDPIKIAEIPVPMMDKMKRPVLDKDMKLQYEMKSVYRSLELEFDAATPKTSITGILKRQLLEIQLQDEARQMEGPVKVDSVPDIEEIKSDDFGVLDLKKLRKGKK